MRKIYELSDGTIQVLNNSILDTYNSFEEFYAGADYFESEYFQIKDLYPQVYKNYFEGKDLIEFQNGRKELVNNINNSFYNDKCKTVSYRKNQDKNILEFVVLNDDTELCISGLEADTISKYKIKSRELLFP